jgi:hypothetical protein
MSKSGQGLNSAMAESCFKRMPSGWLFTAPLVCSRRTYVVTDEQKAGLIEALRRMWRAQILIGLVAAFGLLIFLQDRPPLTQAVAVGSAVIVIVLLSAAYAALRIRPLLVGLPTTNERIPFFEKFKARAVALPKALLIAGTFFSVVLFAGGLVVGLLGKWDLPEILDTVFFGALTLLYVTYFFVRHAANRRM